MKKVARMKKILYGIVPSESWDFGKSKLANQTRDVYSITHQKIRAVVSDIDGVEELRATRKETKAYQKVLNQILSKTDTLLPFNFGTILTNTSQVKSLLSQEYNTFEKELNRLSGQVEMSVTVYWDLELIMKRIGETGDVKKLKKAVKRSLNFYQAKIKLGKKIENILNKKRNEVTEEIMKKMAPISVSCVKNDCFDERMVANTAFLIHRNMEPKFDQRMQELGKSYSKLFTFKYSGPWPPFNFVDIKIPK